MTNLERIINTTTRRIRWQRTIRWGMWSLVGGLALTLALLFSGRMMTLTYPLWLLLGGLLVTFGLIVGAVSYAWLRPYSTQQAGRLIDQRLTLHERVSTALELKTQTNLPPRLVQRQLGDTQRALGNVRGRDVLPLRAEWRWLATVPLLMLAITLATVLPNPQVAVLREQAELEQLVDEQVEQLSDVRDELLDSTLELSPDSEGLLAELDTIIKQLNQPELSKGEALAALAEAEQALNELQEQAVAEGLTELAEQFEQFDSTADLAEALRQKEQEAVEQLLQQAAEQATNDPATAEELAQSLQQAAETARQNGDETLAESLEQAAQAVQSGAPQATQEAVDQASEALNQANEQTNPNQQRLSEALENIEQAQQQLAEQSGQESAQAQGEGQGEGEGNGQGEGAGQDGQGRPPRVGGAGREDPGPGAMGLEAEQGAPDAMETDNGENQGEVGEYDSLFAPSHLEGEGGPIVKPEEQGAKGGQPISEGALDPTQANGPALVPYNEVFNDYQDAASETLENSYVPLGMRGYIRDYFGALEPE